MELIDNESNNDTALIYVDDSRYNLNFYENYSIIECRSKRLVTHCQINEKSS